MLLTRLHNLQNALKEKEIDGMLITNPINRTYMTGFKGSDGYGIVTQEQAYLLTDFRYTQQARKQAQYFEVIQFPNEAISAIRDLLAENNIKKLGFEENTVSFSQYRQFEQKLEVEELIPTKNLIKGYRKIKDKEEQEKMRQAAHIADLAFMYITDYIEVGMTEREIALELEFFMRNNGATGMSFDMIVASGTRSALPHGQPTDKKIEAGDLLTLDFGCVFDGYCSDMTRTIGIQHLSDKQKEIYNVVLEAQITALSQIKAGITGIESDKVARDIIKANGYGEYFGHGLGHGVGYEVHEEPRLSPRGNEVLKSGMVVTVEPGIYVEGLGGVRIEDMVIITEDGIENLTSSPKELIIV